MKVAVVILNWNGKNLLEQFLPSVIEYSKEAAIYVADNNSTDNSISFLETNYPSVKIIRNKSNGGYAKGYNDALQNIEADIYCLLNSDVQVTKDWLKPIIKTFEEHQETVVVQPKILDFKKKNYFEYAGAAGGFIDKYGYPYCRGRIFNTIEEDNGQYNDTTDIFWASGACLFIRSSVFKALGGFDETFFAHMEEIDLCWRAKNLDHKITFVGSSSVYHVGGATLNESNPKKTYLNFRNSLFTLTKNAKGNLLITIIIRLLLDGIAGLKFLFELKFNHFLAVIKAHMSFYMNLKRLLNHRQRVIIKINYYQIKSIAFAYFLKKKTEYGSL